MNIGILTTNQVEDDQRLLEVAIQKGHTASLLDLRFVSIELNQVKAEIYYKNDNITYKFDTILPRINVTYTDYGINVVQHFLSAKNYVSEQPEALRLGRDKFKCLQRLLDTECFVDFDKRASIIPGNSTVVVSEPLDPGSDKWVEVPNNSFTTIIDQNINTEVFFP